jgi:hypothetical protein
VVRVDGLRAQPTVPLLGYQDFRFFLLHLCAPQLMSPDGLR